MPAITYSDFSGGLDRRLSLNSQEANRLWVLKNAYVTTAKRIRKRPCLRFVAQGLTGSHGLEAISGRLKVFVDRGATFTPPSAVDKVELDIPSWAGGQTLSRVYYGDLFSGYAYVVAGYSGGAVGHHYVDTNPNTVITDVKNPRSVSVTKAASRVFAIDGEVVRYCAAGTPRDWTTDSDAGFLPVALNQDTKSACTAVGTFQDSLVVFFEEGSQIWNVAVDPSANAISKRLNGTGCDPIAAQSLASFFNDLVFLSPFGFRSMTVQAQTDRIDDSDVGVPIDAVVAPDIATARAGGTMVFGAWVHQFGQYWAVFDLGTTSRVWAYTYSRSSKIACWSEYTFPVKVTGVATVGGKVYLRSVDRLYEVVADQYTDDGQLVEVEVQMAFQDAKSPGVAKQVYGGDYVVTGSPSVSFKYDPRSAAKESIPIVIPGDTRPGDVLPVEIVAPAIAPVFRHSLDEAFGLEAATFYYNSLGAV